jgi:tetratricopeptide (TPR) repeat protein
MLGDAKTRPAAENQLQDWLRALLSQKRFEDMEQLATAGLFQDAASLPVAEKCQEFRVRTCLAAGKPKEALALAKGLYNLCAMRNTSRAIDLISECIYDLNKDNDPAAAVRKFKLEQIKGASTTATTQPVGANGVPFLASVTIDPRLYESAIASTTLKDDAFAALMAQGNLLLLADRPAEARKAFEKARALSTEKTLVPATEGIARSIRAQDGCVGRANAWVLSLRQQDSGQ